MSTDSNSSNPYAVSPKSVVDGDFSPRGFPWGLVLAVPLIIYGGVALIFGAVGLLCLPGILIGGLSIGHDTTIFKIVVWTLWHAAVCGHGSMIVLCAVRLGNSRWRQAARAFAVAMAIAVVAIGIAVAVSFAG